MDSRHSSPFWPLLGLAAFLAVSISVALFYKAPPPRAPVDLDALKRGAPKNVQLAVPAVAATTTFWVEVASPSKVHEALKKNAWLQSVLARPLGKGFAGGWLPFFESRGEDLSASFRGAVLELVAGQLLDSPYRIAFLSTEGRAGLPVVLLDEPDSGAVSAYKALDAVARRQVFTAKKCPGEEKDGRDIEIARWTVAEHSLFAAAADHRIILARQPEAALQALCGNVPQPQRVPGSDVALVINSDGLQRAAQTFVSALGVKNTVAFGFKLEGDAFVPTGVSGALASARLTKAAPSAQLMQAVPEDVPILLALNVQLPETLDVPSLQGFFSQKATGKTLTRQVAIAWTPRGDRNLPTEVAILWGRTDDAGALGTLFSGPNKLSSAVHCHHVVLASSSEVLERFASACAGRVPAFKNAAPAITSGWAAASSVSLGIHLGRVASQLARDGFWSDTEASPKKPLQQTLPPEIEAARKELEALPYLGFRGVAEGQVLVGGGFRS